MIKNKKYRELPGWIALVYKSKSGTSYQIFSTERLVETSFVMDKYFYVGSISADGHLVSKCLGTNTPFFGDNIKQAMRYLYLKTQKSNVQ